MFTLFFVVVQKGYCLPTSYQNVGVVSLIPAYLYIQAFRQESYTNMHVHIVLCCGAKRVLFTNKLSECWCCIINPYLFTKFHTSKLRELHKLACPIVMYGLKLFIVVFLKIRCLPNFNMPIPCVSPKSISLPSFICGCTPVSEICEFNQKKNSEKRM